MGFIANAYNDLVNQRIAPAEARERSGSAARREETAARRRRQSREEDNNSSEVAVDTFESTQEAPSED